MSLIARYLEANGVSTMIFGSAIDIVEHCGVPRFLFTDFPLGNPCGVPFDREMQRLIVEKGLDLLENASAPRTTVRTLFRWSDDQWRPRYLEVRAEDATELAEQGKARRAILTKRKTEL